MARQRSRQISTSDDAERDLGPDADAEAVARTILLNKLTERARSRHELEQALAARHVPDHIAARLLDRFQQVNLVDDRAFAASWVESRHMSRKLSRRALTDELRKKGIDDDVIAQSVGPIDADREREAATSLVARKIAATRRLDRQARFRRLTAMLARRGFGPALSAGIVRNAIAEDEAATGCGPDDQLDEVIREDFGLD